MGEGALTRVGKGHGTNVHARRLVLAWTVGMAAVGVVWNDCDGWRCR